MYLEGHPFRAWIETYFPVSEWERAACVSFAECPPNLSGYPATCVQENFGSKAFGIFGLAEQAWDPEVNPLSPFTRDEWARAMDPNVGTWIASVIWERNGWRAWTTCLDCGACAVRGGPIPYPRGAVLVPENMLSGPIPLHVILMAGGLALAGIAVAAAAHP